MGEVLILAKDLVNGATVQRERVEDITFWHVELDSHDILLANNLPAESFLSHREPRLPSWRPPRPGSRIDEGETPTHADVCRPVMSEPAMLAFLRERTLARAFELGWTSLDGDDLHLVVDGEARRPLVDQGPAMFMFPAEAREVRLDSHVFEPADLGFADARSLGVMLSGLVFVGGDGEARMVAVDDARLRDGVHPTEGRFRWTDGSLALDPQLWEGLIGDVTLLVSRRRDTVRGWARARRGDRGRRLRTGPRPRLGRLISGRGGRASPLRIFPFPVRTGAASGARAPGGPAQPRGAGRERPRRSGSRRAAASRDRTPAGSQAFRRA